MADESTTQLRLLQENGATVLIAAEAWRQLIEVAKSKGWPSEFPSSCYWGDIGLDVEASDARRLGRTFAAMREYLIDAKDERADTSELLTSLDALVVFCKEGGFRVC